MSTIIVLYLYVVSLVGCGLYGVDSNVVFLLVFSCPIVVYFTRSVKNV